MDNLANIDLSVLEAGYSLSYLLTGVKLVGTIVVFFIGKMLDKESG